MSAKNTSFYGSLLLNAALVAALAWSVWWRPFVATNARVAPDATSISPPEPQPAPRPANQPAPFRWSQLESSDYRVYIANLRRVGCPELTIRELVKADLADLYDARRKDLMARVPGGTNHLPAAIDFALRQLQNEQAAALEQLLGPDASGTVATNSDFATNTVAAADDSAAPSNQVHGAPGRRAAPSQPAVFMADDPSSLGLNPSQLAIVQKIRSNFIQNLGGADADPTSPDYLARWQKAESMANDQARAMLGHAGFLALQQHGVAGGRPVRTSP